MTRGILSVLRAPSSLSFLALLVACSVYGCSLLVDTEGLLGAGPASVDGGDASVGGPDTGAFDAPVPPKESGPNPLRCDRSRPFGAPTLVTELSSGSEDESLQLSEDELTATFGSNRAGTSDIYVASRTDRDAPFGAPTVLIGTSAEERAPSMAANGLRLVYTLGLHLAEATRATTTSSFAAPNLLDTLNSGVEEGDAFLAADGVETWFASRRAGDWDVYVSTRLPSGADAPPVRVDEVSVGGVIDGAPVLSFDRRSLFFTSRRLNEDNIFVAERGDVAKPFGAPRPVAELNSAFTDRPSWISADECVIYIVSARNGTWDFWRAKRP